MALKVTCSIASDIAESEYYSIMANESTEVSNIEHLDIVVFFHSDDLSSSLHTAELCAVAAQKNAKLSVTVL